jgi:hypothetical protein
MSASPGSSLLVTLLKQLLGESPALLAYLVGFILAIAYRRRWPTPCKLVALGTGLLFITNAGFTVLLAFIMDSWSNQTWNDFGGLVWFFEMISNSLHAVGFVLVLAAVFTGRRTRLALPVDEELQPTRPVPRFPGDQGITDRPPTDDRGPKVRSSERRGLSPPDGPPG